MKAIMIDPVLNMITECEYSGDYKEIYKLIDCNTFTCVDLGFGETLYLDDEGLFKDETYLFQMDGAYQPFAGKGLILGTDDEGDSTSTRLTPLDVAKKVEFLGLCEVQL